MTASKIVLVTGANTGLGLEIVRALCRSNTPYEILLASRSLSKGEAAVETVKNEIPASSSTVSAVQLDVSDEESITNAYRTISTKYDRLDALINNAG